MFPKTFLLAAMLSLALAAPSPRATAPEHFTLLALHYGSPIREQPIAFYGNRWVIDLPTITPCEASNCTAFQDTISAASLVGNGTLAPYTGGPGFQYSYVFQNGSVANTLAHDSGVIPEGGSQSPWTLASDPGLQFNGTGFFACPAEAGLDDVYYKIFADIAGFAEANCTDIQLATVPYVGLPAFEYD